MPDCWPNHCWLCTGCTCLCGFVDYSWLHCRGYIFALALCGCRCRFLQCNAMPQPHALVYSYSLLLWSAKGSCFRCCKKLSLEVSEWVWLCCNDQSWICCCHFFLPGFISCFISGFPGFRPSLFLLTGRRPGESCHAQSNFILWIPSEDLYLSNYFYISISISLSFASQ